MAERCLHFDEKGVLCQARASRAIIVKTETINIKVPLCTKHLAIHNEREANLRTRTKQRQYSHRP